MWEISRIDLKSLYARTVLSPVQLLNSLRGPRVKEAPSCSAPGLIILKGDFPCAKNREGLISHSTRSDIIGLIYKVAGVFIAIAAIIVAVLLLSVFDIRQINTANEFINSMLHQESMVTITEQMKTYFSWGIGALGICLGLITFGIGVILSRMKRLIKQTE